MKAVAQHFNARFLAPLIEKHLPGNPTVLIRNMPGGASARGINYFTRNAKDDGMMITVPTASSLIQFVVGAKAVKYDFADFVPVLTSPLGVIIYSSPKLGVKTGEGEKLTGKNLNFGSRKPTGSELPVIVGFDLLNYKIKFIGGLSRGKARQAFARGETNLNYDTTTSWSKKVVPLVNKGKAVPLFTYGSSKIRTAPLSVIWQFRMYRPSSRFTKKFTVRRSAALRVKPSRHCLMPALWRAK